MRILKYKIAQALKRQQFREGQRCYTGINIQALTERNLFELNQRQLRKRALQAPSPQLTPKGSTSCKNVMKDYSRAFIAFSLSPLALPYLTSLLQKHQVDLPSFIAFVKSQKKVANCIKGLRDSLLLVTDADSDQISGMKQVFQEVCMVFLKFFCVNWIYHSKVVDKTAHLSYRLKLLRKIRNPVGFSSLEEIH